MDSELILKFAELGRAALLRVIEHDAESGDAMDVIKDIKRAAWFAGLGDDYDYTRFLPDDWGTDPIELPRPAPAWRPMDTAPTSGDLILMKRTREGRPPKVAPTMYADQKYHSNPRPYWDSLGWNIEASRTWECVGWMPMPEAEDN